MRSPAETLFAPGGEPRFRSHSHPRQFVYGKAETGPSESQT